jgi:hypothetical protein
VLRPGGVLAALWNALLSAPADRDAVVHRIRGYLDGRPDTSSGEFVPPTTTEVLRALRR